MFWTIVGIGLLVLLGVARWLDRRSRGKPADPQQAANRRAKTLGQASTYD